MKHLAGQYLAVDRVEEADGRRWLRLTIVHQQGFEVVDAEEVLWLDGDINCTHFMLADGSKITCARTLKDYEKKLVKYDFFRIEQGTLINLRQLKGYIKPLKKSKGGRVKMSNGVKLDVARRRKQAFLEKFFGGGLNTSDKRKPT